MTIDAALAAIPIAVMVFLMVVRRWSAARAGFAALMPTVVLAVAVFDFAADGGELVRAGSGSAAEAAFIALTVAGILVPALAIYALSERKGALAALRGALASFVTDRGMAAFVVAWFFGLFLEGAAGFGTPVALAAPFLVSLGVAPLPAVTAVLLGHAAGVSFGAIGTPVLTQAGLTDRTAAELARLTAPYHLAISWSLALVVGTLVARALPGSDLRWRWTGLAAACFLVPMLALAWFAGAEVPTLGGALVGMSVFLLVARRRASDRRSGPGVGAGLLRDASPYLALVAGVLVTRLVPPISDALVAVELRWSMRGGFGGSVQPLYHPGFLLSAAFVFGAVMLRSSRDDVRASISQAGRRVAAAMVGLFAVLAVARVMVHSHMIDELASAAASAGDAWPILAPAVGALGTFMTGSATASNVMFTEFQSATAVSTGLPSGPLLGAQAFGAAIGNVACPHNIVAASVTVGIRGDEGAVLRRTAPVALALLAAGGLLAWVATMVSG